MGATYCVKYCGKSEKEPNPEVDEKKTINNQFYSNNDSVPQHNYNHFSKKFDFDNYLLTMLVVSQQALFLQPDKLRSQHLDRVHLCRQCHCGSTQDRSLNSQ